MKERSQIQFDSEQATALKARAASDGASISAVVRDAVTQYLRRPGDGERLERLLGTGGLFRSGARNVAEEHDRYLVEDFG